MVTVEAGEENEKDKKGKENHSLVVFGYKKERRKKNIETYPLFGLKFKLFGTYIILFYI